LVEIKKLPAVYYVSPNGNEPVREWLKDLKDDDWRRIGRDIATAEFGWPVGMPVRRKLGNRLCEIRSNISDGRIARVIFAAVGRRMVLLHGFVKKSQKTSKPDLDLATKRLKEITK